MPGPFSAALGKFARLAVGPVGGNTVDTALSFTGVNPGCVTEQVDTTADKALGTRTHSLSGSVDNRKRVAPSLSLKPALAEWAAILPWVMGGTVSSTSYPLGDREATRYVAFDDTQRVFTMSDVAVGEAVFACGSGGPLLLDLTCAGTDYTTATAFPTGLTVPAGPPFIFADMAVKVGSTNNVNVRSARLSVNHFLDAERYFYGLVSAGAIATDRAVTVDLEMPYGLHAALWDAGAGAGGVQVRLTFTRGTKVLTLNMPTVRAMAPPPDTRVPAETFLPWSGMALSDTANAELSCTLAG